MNKIIIGIDTGLLGGITITRRGVIKETHLMPTFKVVTKTRKKPRPDKKKHKQPFKEKNYVNGRKLVEILSGYPDAEVFIEEVHSLHKMTAASNFSMGQANGILQGVVMGFGYSYYLVKPRMWQKAVWKETDKFYFIEDGKKKLDTKATSLSAASRFASSNLFIPKGCRTPKDGMYDSFLIAKYGEAYLREQGGETEDQLELPGIPQESIIDYSMESLNVQLC